MWFGKPARVTLNVDLTQYHGHLTPGVTGTLIPDLKCSMWGSYDRFGAVRFDCCGATLDILLGNLTIEPTEDAPDKASAKAEHIPKKGLRSAAHRHEEIRKLPLKERRERAADILTDGLLKLLAEKGRG